MNKQPAKFGYIPIGTLLMERSLDQLAADYARALENIGGRRLGLDAITNSLPMFYFLLTGGTEREILDLWTKRKEIFPQEPVYLLTHPGNNSLPAAMEVLARLQQDDRRGRILYLNSPKDEPVFRQISEAAGDLATLHKMNRARIGLVGAPSDWLAASSPSSELVRKTWGPEVVPIPFDKLKRHLTAVPEEETGPILDSLRSKATEVREPSEKALKDAVAIYLALKKLVGAYRLDAITVRCFDLVLEQNTTACSALAQLNDEGIMAGCEGDLISTTGLLWVRTLLGQTAWMANPAQMDVKDNSLWLAHCTIPRSMVEAYRLRSHFESGLGVAIQGNLPNGPVTLLRIGGPALDRIWLAEGEIVQTGAGENLCRTQARVRLTERSQVEALLNNPLGNHLLLIPDHHAGHLRRWWEMMIDPGHW